MQNIANHKSNFICRFQSKWETKQNILLNYETYYIRNIHFQHNAKRLVIVSTVGISTHETDYKIIFKVKNTFIFFGSLSLLLYLSYPKCTFTVFNISHMFIKKTNRTLLEAIINLRFCTIASGNNFVPMWFSNIRKEPTRFFVPWIYYFDKILSTEIMNTLA